MLHYKSKEDNENNKDRRCWTKATSELILDVLVDLFILIETDKFF